MPVRQQFNVNLDPDLIRAVKHHAVDAQLSLSELVRRVLEHHLAREATVHTAAGDAAPPAAGAAPGTTETSAVQPPTLTLQPMVHVEQMAPALSFYEALGGSVLHGSRDGDFVMLQVGGAQLALLAHPPNPEQGEGFVELNFETAEPLEQLQQRLTSAQVTVAQPVTDEGFGRQLQLRTPDGLLVKVNQLEPELYT